MIRVLLVDDSPLVLHILQRLLERTPEIQVAGTAANGKEALDLLPVLDPDVICTDLHMPVMNGLEFTREVMARHPRPILVISVSVEEGSPNVFRLLEAGAVDVFPKPRAIQETDFDRIAGELSCKIRILSGVKVLRRRNATKGADVVPPPRRLQQPPRMVVIGASTGGPQALREILSSLPKAFPLPLVCVQHISSGFLAGMVEWLDDACVLPVRIAKHGEMPRGGMVYFAPDDAHLEWGDGGRFLFSLAPPLGGHRPSVTVTMRSAAYRFGSGTIGVLLTGMGRDGADGMASIAAAGGITLAQDEASCVVYGMPREAKEQGAVQYTLSLEKIAPALENLATGDNTSCIDSQRNP